MDTNYIFTKLVSGAALRVLSLGSTIIVSFFMMPFLVHNLGNEQYGLWLVVAAIVGFYGFFDFGIGTAVGKYISSALGKDEYDRANHIINTSFFLFLGIGILIVILSFVLSGLGLLADRGNAKTFAILMSIIGANVGIVFPLRIIKGILMSQVRFDLIVYVNLFKLFTRTSLVILFINNGFGVIALACITFATEIAGKCLEFYFVRRYAPFVRFFDISYFQKELLRDFIKYSWSVLVMNLSEMARMRLIPVFVSSFIGLNFVVMYGIALRIVEYFELLMKNCVGFVMPVLSRFDGQNNDDLVKRTFEYTAMVSVLITVFISSSLVFYGQEFIQAWMGEEYTHSYTILMLILLPMSLSFAQSASKELLLALSKHSIYAKLTFGEVVCSSIFSIILSTYYGINSIAYATLLGLTAFEIIKPYYVAKCLGTRPIKMYALYLMPAVKSAVVMIAYYFIVRQFIVPSFGNIAILVVGQTILFMLTSYFFIIPKEMKYTLNRIIIRPILSKTMSFVR